MKITVCGNEVLAGAVAAGGAAAAMVAEGRQQGALVEATAAVGVTPILPVRLAAAATAATAALPLASGVPLFGFEGRSSFPIL